MYKNELYHHGIKGQKWGIRRYQNPDGTLTEEGKKRYGNYDLKTGNLNRKGQKIRGAQLAAIGAGVLAIPAAIYIYKGYKNRGRLFYDGIVRAGTLVQNVAKDPNRINNGKAWYGSMGRSDNDKYVGMFGRAKDLLGVDKPGTEKFKSLNKATENIKIAGIKTSKDTFNDLMKKDPTFKAKAEAAIKESQTGLLAFRFRGGDDYDKFNRYALLSPNHSDAANMFYDELKKKGYGAVADVNDRKYSGFNTNAAIFFNGNSFKQVSNKKLTSADIEKAKKNIVVRNYVDQIVSSPSLYLATGAGALVGINSYDSKIQKEIKQMNKENKKEDEKKEKSNDNSNRKS